MPHEIVEAVHGYYRDLEALNRVRRDPDASSEEWARAVEAAVARWQPDCKWRPDAAALVEDASFSGHDGLRQYFSMLREVMQSVEIDLDEVRLIGEVAVAVGRVRARGRGSGATIEEEHGVVYEFREGLIARAVSYRDREKALEAATSRG
jgi:ketosteroid isomerase-like protein